MKKCDLCLEEYQDEFMREDEEGVFCLKCGVEEGFDNLGLNTKLETVLTETFGLKATDDPFILDIYRNIFGVYVNTYHYLKNMVEVTEWTQTLNIYYQSMEFKGYPSDKLEVLADKFGYQIKEDNTYNYENVLRQDLQFYLLYTNSDYLYDDDTLIAIEVHRGGDIRGNYSDLVIFRPIDLTYFMMGLSQLTAYDGWGNIWDSDNAGYSWEYVGDHDLDDDSLIDHIRFDKDANKIIYEGTESALSFSNYGATGF